jgi:hypothetical protein
MCGLEDLAFHEVMTSGGRKFCHPFFICKPAYGTKADPLTSYCTSLVPLFTLASILSNLVVMVTDP